MIESIEDERLITAIEESWWEQLQYLSSTPWGKLYEDQQIKIAYTKPFDGVVTANLKENNVNSKISEITEWFSQYTKKFYWWLTPSMKPSTLSKHLIANGFQEMPPVSAMAKNLNTLDKTPSIEKLVIKKVTDPKILPIWSEVFLVGHGLGYMLDDGSKMFNAIGVGKNALKYLGYYNDEPVSSSQIYFGDEVARLNYVSTMPGARGKGIGSAISLVALNEAKERGYKVAVLYATDMGYPIYKRFGFQDICKIKMYSKELTP
jgi:GNAT superfamily N-acetyltransferase